jgi:hypothetical protein
MDDREIAQLLARINIADNRQVDEMVLGHWKEMVGDLPYQDALEAVNMHFRESLAYLLPAHVRANVERIQRDRAQRQVDAPPKVGAPKPKNFDAMSRAWNDPVEFARQEAIYNQQLIDEGFPPLYEDPR